MGQKDDFLAKAQAEVGYVEGPKDNETKFGAWNKHNFQPWCGSFVDWVAAHTKVVMPKCVYTPAGVEGFKGKGRWSNAATAKPKPGDIAFFDFVEDKVPVEHVGIVVKDNGDGTVTTIEGNTSPEKKKGSQANGGQVAERIRAYRVNNKRKLQVFIVGFGTPKFKD